MQKQSINAIFSGADGSLGFVNGNIYALYTWMDTPTKEIETMGRQNIFIEKGTDPNVIAEYESIKSFTDNWSNITALVNAHKKESHQSVHSISTKHTSRCLEKAGDNEPIFVLRAKDPTSPKIVIEWVAVNVGIQPQEKLEEALSLAGKMMEWNIKNA